MNRIGLFDWLQERTRWSNLACSRLPAVSREKNFPESQEINPLFAKLFRSRWLDISLVLELIDLDSVSVHKHAEKELGQYPAILTSRVVNNPYIFTSETIIRHWHSGQPSVTIYLHEMYMCYRPPGRTAVWKDRGYSLNHLIMNYW